MNKTEILKLVADCKNDSRKKSEKAEKELIKICEPIIKKYCNIASEYGYPCTVGWDSEYMSDRGSIDTFDYYENGVLHFSYTDACMGETIVALVNMPLDWLDETHEEKYRKFCKAKNIALLESEVLQHENMVKNLKEQIQKLEEK